MKKRRLPKKHSLFILSVFCLVFILSVIGVFSLYQHRLNERIHAILTNGLQANTREQKHHAELVVSILQGVLCTLDSSGAAVPEDGLELSIEEFNFQIDYLEADEIRKLTSSPELSDRGKMLCQRLMSGEDAITELGDPLFTSDSSLFALLHPVFRNGSLTRVLRTQIDVAILTRGDLDSVSLFQKVYVILAAPDGSVIYADTPYPNGQNFFSSAVQGGIDPDSMEAVHRTFEETEDMVTSFYGKGNRYYMSWASLDFTDWRVIKFARSPDVVLQTTTLLKGVIATGLCLIVLTVLFCIVLIYLMLRQKHQLQTQQRRYEALSQFNDTLLFEYDVILDRVIFTPNSLERLDLNNQCLEGISGKDYILHLLHPDDQETFSKTFPLFSIVLEKTYYAEARFRCKDGMYYWFGCQFKSIENQGKQASRIVGKLVDISDHREHEQILQQAVMHDSLTGVYNRAAESLINNLLEKDMRGLFFMIDLDNFKSVNDTYGHAAGDTLLVNVAQILKEIFRPDDIVARIGGDEFIVFLSGTNDPKIAEKKAAAILSHMEHLYLSGIVHSVSASIGAAIAPQDGSTYDALTRAADQAMYAVKQSSKKGFSLHNRDAK